MTPSDKRYLAVRIAIAVVFFAMLLISADRHDRQLLREWAAEETR